jgi:hypothetical protein
MAVNRSRVYFACCSLRTFVTGLGVERRLAGHRRRETRSQRRNAVEHQNRGRAPQAHRHGCLPPRDRDALDPGSTVDHAIDRVEDRPARRCLTPGAGGRGRRPTAEAVELIEVGYDRAASNRSTATITSVVVSRATRRDRRCPARSRGPRVSPEAVGCRSVDDRPPPTDPLAVHALSRWAHGARAAR